MAGVIAVLRHLQGHLVQKGICLFSGHKGTEWRLKKVKLPQKYISGQLQEDPRHRLKAGQQVKMSIR